MFMDGMVLLAVVHATVTKSHKSYPGNERRTVEELL